jgi:hypothetical protein
VSGLQVSVGVLKPTDQILMLLGLYLFQQFGNAFGGLIAAGLLKLDGVHGIAGWRWLFIV